MASGNEEANLKEEELFPPLKAFYEAQGCEVWTEVGHSDVVIRQDKLLFAVELKTSFSIKLLDQLVARMNAFDGVYAAIPVPAGQDSPANAPAIRRILAALGMGLILIFPPGRSERIVVSLQPNRADYITRARAKHRKRVLREIHGRYVDAGRAGVSGRETKLSAYRQQSLLLVDALGRSAAPQSPRNLARQTGVRRAQQILSADLHGWFERVARGQYSLSSAGKTVLASESEIINNLLDAVRKARS